MNGKLAVAFVAALVMALIRCGGDECTTASDHLASCAPPSMGSSSSGMMAPAAACAGAPLCKATCINEYSCSQILGNDPAYTACLNGCNGK